MEENNLKLITLYREAVHQQGKDDGDDELQGMDDHRRLTLTMDYFDALEVKTFSMKYDNVRAFFGQNTNEELRDYDVAMHSIPLYWPSSNFTKKFAKENRFYGDTLGYDKDETDTNKANFLCLIQVYITPEVLRRIDIYKGIEGETPEAASKAYDFFFEDLHIAMQEFTENCLWEIMENGTAKCKDESFRYCIYQSLSVGDYMIGIRCRCLDYVFQIMEAIRRRKFVDINGKGRKVNGEDPQSLILYKTYTIVSINDLVIPEEDGVAKTLVAGNRFILRAVLSNHYWNDEKELEKKFPPDIYLYSSEFKRLHGRYNFSVEMSEAAFFWLLPTIEKYKLNRKAVTANGISLSTREMEICKFLKYLLEHDYISQLNERYVSGSEFRKDEKVKEVSEKVTPFCGFKKKKGFLNCVIRTELGKLNDKIIEIAKRVKKLDTSRSTISYNMSLLRRMVNICSTINGYSDSRVYVVIILRLIYATLNGLEEYLDYFDNTDEYDIITHLDSELNDSVADLKEFSDYILDNSLQSLQAPDYNLESHISIEKLMMSYSAFLQRVVDWYRNTEFAKKIGGMQERYVAIMVPRSTNSGLSTKAYFYRQDDSAQERREKLLVVYCPSFDTLTDFAGSLGRLLHELAHNLRYEDRGARNEMIIRYSAGLLINQLAADLVERVRTEVENLGDAVALQGLLETIFKENFISYIKLNIPDYRDLKLLNLTKKIEQCYLQMIDAAYYLGMVKRYINKFARSSDNSILSDKEVEKLWDFYEGFFGENSESWNEIDDEGGEKTERLAREQADARKELIEILKNCLFKDGKPIEENRDKKDANGLFDVLCSSFPDEYAEDVPDENSENPEKRLLEQQFFTICMRTASFIRKLTKGVVEMVNEYQHTPDGKKVARYLAMGYYFVSDDSSLDFMEFAQGSLLRTRVNSIEMWNENLYMYREIASDLFMVKMLGLTPFGYLNFCTRYIPADGKLNREFVSRMAMTIYAMDGSTMGEEAENQFLRLPEIFSAMCCYIEGVIRDVYDEQKNDKTINRYFDDFASRMNHYSKLSKKTNSRENMQALADLWSQNLKWFCEQVTDELVVQKLMHCVFLCRNFIQIADYYGIEIGEIEWAEELSRDLVNGGTALDELHKELEQSPLWSYCCSIQGVFNEPKVAKMNYYSESLATEKATKFVLDMHYDMLFNSIDKFNESMLESLHNKRLGSEDSV